MDRSLRRVGLLDRIVYRLFYWRWKPLFEERADLLIIFQAHIEEYKRRHDDNT